MNQNDKRPEYENDLTRFLDGVAKGGSEAGCSIMLVLFFGVIVVIGLAALGVF